MLRYAIGLARSCLPASQHERLGAIHYTLPKGCVCVCVSMPWPASRELVCPSFCLELSLPTDRHERLGTTSENDGHKSLGEGNAGFRLEVVRAIWLSKGAASARSSWSRPVLCFPPVYSNTTLYMVTGTPARICCIARLLGPFFANWPPTCAHTTPVACR